eukprot:3271447-Prymnesium_polylepis.1
MSPVDLISSSNVVRCELISVPKMRVSCVRSGKVMFSTWNQWSTRIEMLVRPPPGWPMPAISCTSLTKRC